MRTAPPTRTSSPPARTRRACSGATWRKGRPAPSSGRRFRSPTPIRRSTAAVLLTFDRVGRRARPPRGDGTAAGIAGDRAGRHSRPRGRRHLDGDRERPADRRGAHDAMGHAAARFPGVRLRQRHGERRAGPVADLVPRRGIDGPRLQPVLPAAEPAGHRGPRHRAFPAVVGRGRHAQLRPRPAEPDDDLCEQRRRRAGSWPRARPAPSSISTC